MSYSIPYATPDRFAPVEDSTNEEVYEVAGACAHSPLRSNEEPQYADDIPHRTPFFLTMRDYFARSAMQAIINSKANLSDEQIARTAYRLADCMLVEREISG